MDTDELYDELGVGSTTELVAEYDDGAMMIVAMAIQDHPETKQGVAMAIERAGKVLRDEAGVNIMRLLRRHEMGEEIVHPEDITDGMVTRFEPEGAGQ